jgi:hypothetical protein
MSFSGDVPWLRLARCATARPLIRDEMDMQRDTAFSKRGTRDR